MANAIMIDVFIQQYKVDEILDVKYQSNVDSLGKCNYLSPALLWTR